MTTFAALREANAAREEAWCDTKPDMAFRGLELGGEVGEALNVMKKLERERHGWRGSRATLDELADELADVVICADLAAASAGIDLDAAVVRKFNATSEKVGLPQRLPSGGGPTQEKAPMTELVIDDLAQEIRRVDGNHDLGAGALAEALMPFIRGAYPDYPEGVTMADHIAHDMTVGRFPEQSDIGTFLAERAAGKAAQS